MTVYYVLNQLGPHSKGDVLSFSPEQIGAGVDITHLTSIGAIRVATPLLDPPSTPTLATAGSGGTVLAGVYTVKISYVTAVGETTPSPSATITTSGTTSTLTVNSPAPATGATGWYASISQVGGSSLTRQQTAPTPIGTNLVLTAPPTSTGPAPLVTNASGEAARAVPAQIQATHAPQGVGVFTNNGVPDNTTYAGIAAYGSLCWNVAVSPPAIYVNTGTVAAPTWTASGGLAGLTSDGDAGIRVPGIVGAAHIATGSMTAGALETGMLGVGSAYIESLRGPSADQQSTVGGFDTTWDIPAPPHTQTDQLFYGFLLPPPTQSFDVLGVTFAFPSTAPGAAHLSQAQASNIISVLVCPAQVDGTPTFDQRVLSLPRGQILTMISPGDFLFPSVQDQTVYQHGCWLFIRVTDFQHAYANGEMAISIYMDTTSSTRTTLTLDLGVTFTDQALSGVPAVNYFLSDPLPVNAIAAAGGIGEYGVPPPGVRPPITGNVTTGSLANLQTVVGQLLTALDAKGSITKSTT